MDETNKDLFELLDTNAKTLVGTLLKRLEILEKENVLTPTLIRALIKEHIYESNRTIKTIIKIGRVVFKSQSET